MKTTSYEYEAGMIINCTLKTSDVNPKEVNYTWFSCNSLDTCNKDPLTKSSSLQLDSQPNLKTQYICKASNGAGSDNQSITVFRTKIGKCTNIESVHLRVCVERTIIHITSFQ